MGKPALQAPAFSMGRDKQTATRRKDRPAPSCMPQAPRLPARTPRTAHHQGRRNTKDGATPRMGRLAPKTGQRNIRAGAAQPQKRNLATSGMERCNPKNEIARHQSWSGATKKRSGATSGTKQRNPIDRTAQPSRSSVSFEARNQRPGRRFGHTHGAICRETAQAARACKGSGGRNLTAH